MLKAKQKRLAKKASKKPKQRPLSDLLCQQGHHKHIILNLVGPLAICQIGLPDVIGKDSFFLAFYEPCYYVLCCVVTLITEPGT